MHHPDQLLKSSISLPLSAREITVLPERRNCLRLTWSCWLSQKTLGEAAAAYEGFDRRAIAAAVLVQLSSSSSSKSFAKFFHTSLCVLVGCPTWCTRKPGKKPEPENSGQGRAGFHLIKFQVSRAMPQKNPKIRVGSGFGFFRVFAHSTWNTSYLLSCLVRFLSNGNNDHNSAGYHLESSKIFYKDCMLPDWILTYLNRVQKK